MSRDAITFFRTPDGRFDFRTETGVFGDLGTWLVSDVAGDPETCLEALAILEDVRAGEPDFAHLGGGACEVTARPGGVQAAAIGQAGTAYTLDETHAVLARFLVFLVPDPNHRREAVTGWEKAQDRSHPCHAHLP